MICEAKSDLLPELSKQAVEEGAACVVDFSRTLMDVARKESCGECVLCREGTWQVYEILDDITEGKTQNGDFELITELLEVIRSNGGCEMSRSAADRCLQLMEEHSSEWDLHTRRKRCTNLVCKTGFTLYVDPALCDGCGKCVEVCPKSAIAGGEGMIHVIDRELCDKCMLCVDVCPKGAIKKAGPVKPVPVGGFATTGDEGRTTRRRRRG